MRTHITTKGLEKIYLESGKIALVDFKEKIAKAKNVELIYEGHNIEYKHEFNWRYIEAYRIRVRGYPAVIVVEKNIDNGNVIIYNIIIVKHDDYRDDVIVEEAKIEGREFFKELEVVKILQK